MTNSSTQSGGTLHIVATPIGNLDDLSGRAAKTLASVALIAAEDTRHSKRLLAHIGIDGDMVSLHEHNEDERLGMILAVLADGRDVALISDAGTPLLSDPGLKLLQAAIEQNVPIVAIPGPSAITAALSVAGLATDRFVFEGFLPRKREARRNHLAGLASETRTLVFFESVHRVGQTLADMAEILGGERDAALARELTKLNEQVARGTLAELLPRLGQDIPLRGEFVVLVAGNPLELRAGDEEILQIYQLLAAELKPDRAVALTARISGRKRNEVYALTRT